MTYRGKVVNGVIVFDVPHALPDGAVVDVNLVEPPSTESNGASPKTLYDELQDVIGQIDDLPEDFARQHDHYLRGTPRR
jgi:hypothetical protein